MFSEIYPGNISALIPAIPRLLTALAEWSAVFCTVFLMRRRFSARKTLVILAAALPVQIFLRCVYGGYMARPVFSIFMIINLLFMLLCLAVLTKEELCTVVFAWMLAFLTAEFTASLIWQICCMALEAPSMLDPAVLAGTITGLAAADLIYWFFIRYNVKRIHVIDWKSAIIAVGISVLVFVASNVNVFREALWMGSTTRDMREMIGWIRTTSDICGIVLLWLILRLSGEHAMLEEMKNMERVMDAQYRQYLSFRDSSDYIRNQCHDLKHQLKLLKEQSTEEERAEYLSEMEEMIAKYQSQCDTGNTVLDTILTQFQLRFREKGIRLEYMAQGEALSRLENRDICTIFGNLLENAEESVCGLAEEERLVRLNVGVRKGFLSILTENRCGGTVAFSNGIPLTTKKDARSHGIGTNSIRFVAEKYNGTVQFDMKDGWFSAAILIPLQ